MYVTPTDAETLAAQLAGLPQGDDTLLLLIAEEQQPDLARLVAALNAHDLRFLGGVFPGVIADGQRYTAGSVVLRLPLADSPLLVPHLADPQPALDALPDDADISTVLVLVDGLASHIGGFLSALFARMGGKTRYIGGGAGSLTLQQTPCLFDTGGIYQDAALLAPLALHTALGVRHGWHEIVGPLVATRTDRNVIYELNWEPAFDVYRDVIFQDCGQTITPGEFFSLARSYPFGIYREGMEVVVRDPLSVDAQGGLVCVGEVPQHAVLHVLKGETDSLVAMAGQAAADAVAAISSQQAPRACLTVDCISRVLFLEDDFQRELAALQGALHPVGLAPMGMLSLGEISSYGPGLLEFFNKTIVVGLLVDPPDWKGITTR